MNQTITSLFLERVADTPNAEALGFREGEEWKSISWQEYGERVDRFAKGLLSMGVTVGDRVALIGANSPEWFIADMAIMTMGAVTVPMYQTCSGDQMHYILEHSGSKIFIAENFGYYESCSAYVESLPELDRTLILKGEVPDGYSGLMGREAFEESADTVDNSALDELRALVRPETRSTFIYTSGTTGRPKAVILTHKNCASAGQNVHLCFNTSTTERISCSYLPLSHVADRTINLFSPLFDGRKVCFMRGFNEFAADLRAIRPTIWCGVPRVWEKLYEGVMRFIDSMPDEKKSAIKSAIEIGKIYNWAVYDGKIIESDLEQNYKTKSSPTLLSILQSIGLDRTEIFVTGGAPTSKEILDFYVSLGVWLRDVYGQTEGHGTTSFATKEALRIGSAGKPFPLVEVKIADDGEVLVRGDNVSPGYYKDPTLTAETFRNGWLYSGDLGEIDEDGFLWIKGRKKDIIITSGGKNITPTYIEASLMSSPLIDHAVVVGDGKKYLTALLTVNEQEAKSLAATKGIVSYAFESIPSDALIVVETEITMHVEHVNKTLSRAEQIKKHRTLAGSFTIEGGELTHTQKIRRPKVLEKYRDAVDELYRE